MKALLSTAVGGPETLSYTDLPDPKPTRGEALIAVKAVGVNFPDVLIIEDKYQFKPERPFAPGGEASGVIEALGEGVTHLKVGDRVLAMTGWGAMAEKITADASKLVPVPHDMPFDVAAGFVMTYGTSMHALKDRAKLQKGETLLVLGAAGGVGLAAIEIGKAMGARVVAAVSSEAKAAMARAHGADETLVYPQGPFDKDASKALAAQFKAACGPDGANVIYDPVGGGYAEPALRAIAWEGRYLVVGFPAGIPSIPLNLTLLKSCQIVGVFWGAFATRDPKANQQNLVELLAMWKSGAIKPEISEHYPLERGGEAIERLASRQAMGKVVVTVGA